MTENAIHIPSFTGKMPQDAAAGNGEPMVYWYQKVMI